MKIMTFSGMTFSQNFNFKHFNLCWLVLLISNVFIASPGWAEKNELVIPIADSTRQIIEIKSSQPAYMPLYLSLIEFSKLSPASVLKAKEELQKKPPVKLQEQLSLNPFHQRNSQTLREKMAVSEYSFCRNCHLPLPHQKDIRSRTFNNMHSRYLACESCHLDSQKISDGEKLEYRWFDFKTRTAVKPSPDLFRLTDHTSTQAKPSHIKITPFFQQQVAIITRQHLYVDKLNGNWEKDDLQLKAEIKVRTHQPLKLAGKQCKQCHAEANGLLKLDMLGANQEQIQAYEKNTIAAFFKNYQEVLDKVEQPDNKALAKPQETIQRIRITELLE